ncbi:peptide/nickel transport system substrate-binding protein [Rhodococcoides kyotonense]|uniref:Peptide/nickel transport system substrate-binding protein n=2 Tax=Rhodococcoides kyotonense TaxID=398843 RepID=A0A239N0Z2_9NOCA|nr:peptide/nickel transport system substrate-binding protein [Rhodococcus kyotonensis]
MRRRILVACACVSALVATACLSSRSSSSEPGTLAIATSFQPRTGLAIDTDDAFLLSKIGVAEPSVRAGIDGIPTAALATEWSRVDNTTWEFRLRPGVTFQDGSPLDAAAVVTALDYVTSVVSPPRAVEGVGIVATAQGDDTVRVTTREPDPILPLRLSSPNAAILSPAAYTSTPPNPMGTGTGPFVLTGNVSGTRAQLTANDSYWDSRPALNSVTVEFISDASSRSSALLAGDVDIAENLPPSSMNDLEARDDLNVFSYAAPRTISMFTNFNNPALADPRVREALERAVDKQMIVDSILEGAGEPATEVFGPAVAWGSNETPEAPSPDYAKALLSEAGFTESNPLELRLWTYGNGPSSPMSLLRYKTN